nr:immunoglobulin heavy chain junction region [Mus musculus]
VYYCARSDDYEF